ncbi:helicase BlpT [Streptococcus sp. zg-86]|uniref:Helicase BlpT n=1 Tax=Streptococcus zhangguiae TaxID=2664091 RepID=A0A6I4RKK1_9STRE|nr:MULTISPECIES: helicase BlpT [unclassified Streptococcus]MTB64914.1 helicase BlpT [Streptococcus sp. zg-86]MTB91128.1 helicase BlpT [Streptococcus sp. zg-36]MWV57001.1 helicase BlpT [Streptococcus sp. zg-70]QTH47235.1 helicase BlpT [Streptococcus sp. zg-86]
MDTHILEEAYSLINELEKIFQRTSHQSNYDTIRFQENIQEIVTVLKNRTVVDNQLLIALEKFYQRTSLLMGISSLDVTEDLKQAWRRYDQFHYDQVKPVLKVYGPIGML